MEHEICEFGFPGDLRDRLVAAVLDGTKTATSALAVEWAIEDAALPVAGDRLIVIDSAERPVATIELVSVDVIRLADADDELARVEGEAYRTAEGWRAEHERFWRDEVLPELPADRRPRIDDDTEVVVQRFRLVGVDGDRLPGRRDDPLDPELFAVLAESHARFLRRPLAPAGAGPAWLYRDAPFGVLAHTFEEDPRFVYANEVALSCFGCAWADLVGTPSRLSAEPDRREDRQRLLDAVERDGCFTGYRGRRIARTGRRFWIEDVTMWNLVDGAGRRIGQAARFVSG